MEVEGWAWAWPEVDWQGKEVSMKRKAWIALLGLAVAIVPFAVWRYRMEREAAA